MAKTFTEQCGLPQQSLAGDSRGMHANIPFDYVRHANNLATYCNPHVHFFHGASDDTTNARLLMGITGAACEVFMCQIPLSVPPWAGKMLWTAGVSGNGGSIAAVTVYASPFPYMGVGGTNGSNLGPFDLFNLTHGYSTRSISISVADGAYGLADDSTTGLAVLDHCFRQYEGAGTTLVTYAILTITSASSDAGVELRDFTCWFQP